MDKIFVYITLTFLLIGCTNITKDPPPNPQKIIIKNILDFDIYYEISGLFLTDNEEYIDEIRIGEIKQNEEMDIGSVAFGAVGGLHFDWIKLYNDSNKNNIIYEADLKNIKIVDLTLKEEYQDEELKKIANMFISNEGFGLLVDEKLITEFTNK